jgi:hypothetical protein
MAQQPAEPDQQANIPQQSADILQQPTEPYQQADMPQQPADIIQQQQSHRNSQQTCHSN